jgi:hypothetical protein
MRRHRVFVFLAVVFGVCFLALALAGCVATRDSVGPALENR